MSGYWTGILTILSINVIMAYAIFLPVATGQLNLGGAGFQALGAYTAAFLSAVAGQSAWATIPAAMAVGGVVSMAIAFPLLRTRGVYLVLATFAFAEVVAGAILNTSELGGAMGLSVPEYLDYPVPIIAAILVTLFVFYLMATRFGLTMRACHDDDVVTDLLGVSIRGVRVAAFAIGGALAGLAGALYAHTFSFVEIQSFNASLSIYVLLYVLLGGTQSALGPLFGAAFFTLLPEVLRAVLPQVKGALAGLFGIQGALSPPDESWRFVILGVLTVLMMMYRSEGLITRTLIERLKPGRHPASATVEEASA
ncbi:amino acid/amide ABC transporter membrane protein 2, HAAT family [Rhizobium sp. RU35A]|uniref:Branched-chain amino acid ABC transporter permease n=1 Tax=Rhizobium straminoryzae TaxID=1387186 RepID=A0A549TF69_9HYPH|nr:MULTISPECIES: branched-chain amino acid ABC transporter permease [Rhizobium]TRL41174.1 branched-chain amino acid ABC transporter permease [Rhizobium straminoryzae]SIQ45030.1 amino acid/amide ABC transporter membrane protein 2, HAAT family [Rhizobium sp. RU35A]